MFFNYFLLIYIFSFIAKIGSPHIFYNGGFVFLSVYAYSELTVRNRNALYMEKVKSILGRFIIWFYSDWFFSRSILRPPGVFSEASTGLHL